MNWPPKDKREEYEINEFIKTYKQLSHGREFTIKSRSEKPDYILEDSKTRECFGVELTSAYLSDRSVPDGHIARPDIIEIPYCENSLEQYKNRLFQTIIEKIKKARTGYTVEWPLLLSIYVNEYISIHMREKDWNSFAKEHGDFWDSIFPFIEAVFWSLPKGGIFSIKSADFYASKGAN